MQILAVVRNGFERMPKGMTKIQNGAQTAFGFVLTDDLGFDFATTRHDCHQRIGIAAKELWQIALEPLEERRVVNDSIFDYFCEAGAQFTDRQRRQAVKIAEHKARLVKGAN